MLTVTNYVGFDPGAATGTATPPSTTNLVAWFDFSDSAFLTTSGTSITTAVDKSGHGRDIAAVISGTLTRTPALLLNNQNGLNVADFRDGTNSGATPSTRSPWLRATGTITQSNGDAFFVVAKYLGVAGTFGFAFSYIDVDGATRYARRRGTASANMSVPGASVNSTTSLGNTWNIYAGVTRGINGGTATGTVRVDGGVISSTNSAGGLSSNQPIACWSIPDGQNVPDLGLVWPGFTGEVRMFNGPLSSDDVFREEGYLAWKWGLQGNLPSDHPYKNAAP